MAQKNLRGRRAGEVVDWCMCCLAATGLLLWLDHAVLLDGMVAKDMGPRLRMQAYGAK
jgi:hypothetical protein